MDLLNPGQLEFDAKIIDAGDGGAYVKCPFDVQKLFGTKGRVPIICKIESETYRGSLVNMGTGCHVLIVLRKIRNKIEKNIDDIIHVSLELDTLPRIVEIPADVQKLLAKNIKIKEKFDKLSYSHKKEYIDWINDAKKEETRIKRIGLLVEKYLV